MSGTLKLFGMEFVCVVVTRDDDLHADGDEQQDGIVKFDERLLAIASQESLRDMRRAAAHETIHIALRQNPALMLAFRHDLADSELEHWINAMSTSLVEVCEASEWTHLPHYGEDEE